MAEKVDIKIEKINIFSLFGLYNHEITLNKDGVTIIHGENGVGKTAILTLIAAFFDGNFGFLFKYPYEKFLLTFNDKSVLEIVPNMDAAQERKLNINYKDNSCTIDLNEVDVNNCASRIERRHPYLTQISPDHWRDMRNGDVMSALDVVMRFGDEDIVYESLYKRNEWLNNLIKSINVFFIKTQRLVGNNGRSRDQSRSRRMLNFYTVNQYAEKMREIISQALSDYGKESQLLDQSFPNRVMLSDRKVFSVDELKLKMTKIKDSTSKLKEIKILEDTKYDFNVDMDNLSETHRQVLSTYVEDSEKKLKTLEPLSQKIDLLLLKINDKFLHKKLNIDLEEGLQIFSNNGEKLSLQDLSSGEQHELVLMFDLLFNVKENSLILIDEPEISLHIKWQGRFLDDLIDIISLTKVDVIIATHSPNIIGEHSDVMVELKHEV